MIYGGDGLARSPEGKAVFLPLVLPGEQVAATIVEEKSGFMRAAVDELFKPSERRVQAPCPYFGSCGGCHYQHTDYPHQLGIKLGVLRESFRRTGKFNWENEITLHSAEPWNYRNRTRLKIRTQPEFALGYYKYNSHEFLPVEQCPISSPLINQGIIALYTAGRTGRITSDVEEIELFAAADDTQLLVALYCSPSISDATARKMAEDLHQGLLQTAGLVVFKLAPPPAESKPVAVSGAPELQYKTGYGAYRISAGAFFQVNRHLVDELTKIVTTDATGQTALDLYAGGGLFAAPLARSFAQVIAVESSQTSQSDLAYNSPANVRSVRATVEQYLKNVPNKLSPDLVILDPPRSGLGESVVRGLAALRAPQVTYVSCDPATLARDLGGLLKAGYRIDQAHMIDLFPQTFHLETVLRLVR